MNVNRVQHVSFIYYNKNKLHAMHAASAFFLVLAEGFEPPTPSM